MQRKERETTILRKSIMDKNIVLLKLFIITPKITGILPEHKNYFSASGLKPPKFHVTLPGKKSLGNQKPAKIHSHWLCFTLLPFSGDKDQVSFLD